MGIKALKQTSIGKNRRQDKSLFGKISIVGFAATKYLAMFIKRREGPAMMPVGESSVHSRGKEGEIEKFPAFLFERERLVLLDIEEHVGGAIPYIVDWASGKLYIVVLVMGRWSQVGCKG
jgi:hypothetical protein